MRQLHAWKNARLAAAKRYAPANDWDVAKASTEKEFDANKARIEQEVKAAKVNSPAPTGFLAAQGTPGGLEIAPLLAFACVALFAAGVLARSWRPARTMFTVPLLQEV